MESKLSWEFDPTKINLLIIGNPGVGKSFICNCLTKSSKYESQISASSVTKKLQSITFEGFNVIDSPGLLDMDFPELAKLELERGLKLGGNYKLIFVVATVGGRLTYDTVFLFEKVFEAYKPSVKNILIIVNNSPLLNEEEFIQLLMSRIGMTDSPLLLHIPTMKNKEGGFVSNLILDHLEGVSVVNINKNEVKQISLDKKNHKAH